MVFLGCNSALQLFVDAAHRQGLTVAGIVDSDYWGNTEKYAGQLIIGTEKDFEDPEKLKSWSNEYDFFIGTNWSPDPAHARDKEKRKYLIKLVESVGIRCINLIDPDSYIGSNVKLGDGIYIGYHVYIEFEAVINSFTLLHCDTNIGHKCVVGKNNILQRQSGLGNCATEENVFVGIRTNAFTSGQPLIIGEGAVINQGLWLARSVAPNEHVKLTKDAIRTYQNPTEI